ncbi:phospholipase A [Tamlana sp. 2201CG12-4]|uniref:phospholipase A n=1 Tax=Tamlana sp. 2201CG12-4 TaxID=3112582 RepID=UPI002DB9CAB7|nr:phospholipase A [Tamlana sp. 2201CG12-4]MEC3908110.1 phospholipase A [Tamlana sp. 2201CG12-4]
MNQYQKYKIVTVLLGLLWIAPVNGQGKQQLVNLNNSSLSERWLIKNDTAKTFKILPYKPVYLLVLNYIDDINNSPQSGNPLNTVTTPTEFNNAEFTFQLSFKTRVLRINKNKKQKIDLWVAYTQLSKWQLYNGLISRPFRETNYEPEALIVFPVDYKIFGLEGVYLAGGYNHQSNGRSNPYSRSWNRIMFQAGWQAKNWSIVLNPWIRIQEDSIEDNNPDIENYIGRAELLTAFSKNKHNVSLAFRHSLNTGNNNRGSLRLHYGFQIVDNLHLHLQVFHGYGENLIDYNHKQTTFGLGFSLIRWR